jgi:hypothetical protein
MCVEIRKAFGGPNEIHALVIPAAGDNSELPDSLLAI